MLGNSVHQSCIILRCAQNLFCAGLTPFALLRACPERSEGVTHSWSTETAESRQARCCLPLPLPRKDYTTDSLVFQLQKGRDSALILIGIFLQPQRVQRTQRRTRKIKRIKNFALSALCGSNCSSCGILNFHCIGWKNQISCPVQTSDDPVDQTFGRTQDRWRICADLAFHDRI